MNVARAGFPLAITVFALVFPAGRHSAPAPDPGAPSIQLTSAAFPDGGRIPASFTCDGGNTSPALAWSQPPAGTKSFALIVDDPDAPGGTFVHLVIYNLPSTAHSLPASEPKQPQLADGSRQGRNDFGDIGYGGPCPPGHTPHHYRFVLYAVDASLNLPAGATRRQLDDALKGHVVARGQTTGVYSR